MEESAQTLAWYEKMWEIEEACESITACNPVLMEETASWTAGENGEAVWYSPVTGEGPFFVGSRVPVQTLFDYVESNRTIEQFLSDNSDVTRERAVQVLKQSRNLFAVAKQPAVPPLLSVR